MKVVREMGLTVADFLHHVPLALPDCAITAARVSGAGVEITYEELPPRRLSGLVVLPRLKVTIEADVAFVARFDRVFLRGGG